MILTAGGGCGKTTMLELALEGSPTPVAWVGCSDNERAPGVLLIRILHAIAAAEPGASDALAERLTTGVEQFDPLTATRELISESSRLLIEPLVLVVDDAEHLDGAEDSLRVLGELLRAEQHSLHVAVATRRALELRTARPRATGRLKEISAADLVFDTEECADLLRERTGVDPAADDVDDVMSATEGWPLGIALAAALIGRHREAGVRPLGDLASAPDVRSYLSEEFLDTLDPELRDAAIDSSIARVVTPGLIRALGLPEDFRDRIERAGVLVRGSGGGGFAYHPLLRELLLERLQAQRGDDEQRRLHAATAAAAAEAGDAIAAIERWLEAMRWDEAVAAIVREAPQLLRTSPELMRQWLSGLPPDVQERPAIQVLEGQLAWGAGQHEEAVAPLRGAVAGYADAQDSQHAWLARFFLADALFSAGRFEEMLALSEGWEAPGPPKARVYAAGVAWYEVLALTALGRRDEAVRLTGRLRLDSKTAAKFRYLDDLATLIVDLAAGRADAALIRLRATINELEVHDPQARLPVALSVTGLVHLDIGNEDKALDWFERAQRESNRLGLRFIARDAHLQRAAVLAQRGDLAEAELELERAGTRKGTGWRGVSRHTAEAFVASARGDAGEAVAAAERALARVRPGVVCYRVWAALDMAIVLAENGSGDRARIAVDDAQAALDDQFPGELGSYHRARLLATRVRLEYENGEPERAYHALRRSWEEARGEAHHLARAHWRQLRPVLWQALAEGELELTTVLPALEHALPGGEALVALTDHPEPAVRRAALVGALTSSHPAVLSRLPELAGDPDQEVVAAVVATRERLRRAPPAVRFAVLGRFRVTRGGWEIGAGRWGRPMDPRLVRFLLVHRGEAVPEDLIFEALWPGRSPSSARGSLHVAVSRARGVLDVPGVQESIIESEGQAYRLNLERASVDGEEFRAAAEAALAEESVGQRILLERARSLWAGEPLPEERYSDWATAYRERLIDRYIAVLTGLVQVHERAGDHARAADLARELVEIDRLNEGAHRALMLAYARAGRTGHALRQYLECRRALVEDLGTEPADATSRLQARILAGESV